MSPGAFCVKFESSAWAQGFCLLLVSLTDTNDSGSSYAAFGL